MAESTLALTQSDLYKAVSQRLGWGYSDELPDADEQAVVNACVRDGLLRAYYPLLKKDESVYGWSFLRPTATLSLSSGTQAYDLPDGCDGHVYKMALTTGVQSFPIRFINPLDLLQLKARENAANATPVYAAIRPKTTSGSTTVGQRWEVLFYPTPNATITASYTYSISPDAPGIGVYTLGGPAFGQVILAACLARAEEVAADGTSDRDTFQMVLAAAVERDRLIWQETERQWQAVAPVFGTWSWLLRESAGAMFNVWNLNLLAHDERMQIESIVERAIQNVYYPPVEGGHRWSFLNPTATLALSNGTAAYDLPSGFSGLRGSMVLTVGSTKTRVQEIDENDLVSLQSVEAAANAMPRYVAIRPKTTTGSAVQGYEAVFYPIPNGSFTASYRYDLTPATPSTSNEYLYGPPFMANLFRQACIAELEQVKQSGDGEQTRFKQHLDRAIEADRRIREPDGSPWSMTEPTFGTWSWLRREVSMAMLGRGNTNLLTHSESGRIDNVVRLGLQRVYHPDPVEGDSESHLWTFLNPTATLALSSGTAAYDLPADFRAMTGPMVATSGSGPVCLEVISEEQIRIAQTVEAPANAPPKYVAIRPKAAAGTSQQVFEAVFYPTPNGSFTITYRYARVPASPSTSAEYPYGAPHLAGLFRRACLLEAGVETDREAFAADLRRMILADRKTIETESKLWSITEPTYGTFDWYKRYVAGELYGIWSLAFLSHTKIREVELIVNRGIRHFYTAATGDEPHSWSFLRPEATLALASGTFTYNLPVDCTSVFGTFEFVGANQRPIQRIDPDRLLQLRASEGASNAAPTVFATRHKTSDGSAEQGLEVLFYPTPDAIYSLRYHYVVVPPDLTSSLQYPWGGKVHAETILASCLMVAASHARLEQTETRRAEFDQRLRSSIQLDRQIASDEGETWTAAEPTYGTFSWFQRELGREVFGNNPTLWTLAQQGQVNTWIQRGLRQFYTPPAIEADGRPGDRAHRWSFLSPRATLALSNGTATYDLPADLEGVLGEFSFAGSSANRSIHQISDAELRSLQATAAATGVPKYFSLTPKTTSMSAAQQWQVSFYPTPGSSLTVTYQYRVNAATLLSVSAPYPYGGTVHAETILASCRCIKAQGTPEYEQAYAVFMQRLGASISSDRQFLETMVSTWSVTAPVYGTFDWLLQELGAVLLSANSGAWTHEEQRKIESLAQRGIRQFCVPSMAAGDTRYFGHRWSFLYVLREMTTNAPYSTGTIAATSGVVTLSGGTWPSWAADGELVVGGVTYQVATRDSDTQITLVDTSKSVTAGSTYSLPRRFYTLASDIESIEGTLTYRSDTFGARQIKLYQQSHIDNLAQMADSSGIPHSGTVNVVYSAGNVASQRLELWPRADAVYELKFKCKLRLADLVPGDVLPGDKEHAETILKSALAIADPSKYRAEFLEMLAASIQLDQATRAPERIADVGNFCGGSDSDHVTLYEGQEYN